MPGVTYVLSVHKTDAAHPSLAYHEVHIFQHFADQPKQSDAYDPAAVDIILRVRMASNEFIFVQMIANNLIIRNGFVLRNGAEFIFAQMIAKK